MRGWLISCIEAAQGLQKNLKSHDLFELISNWYRGFFVNPFLWWQLSWRLKPFETKPCDNPVGSPFIADGKNIVLRQRNKKKSEAVYFAAIRSYESIRRRRICFQKPTAIGTWNVDQAA